MDGLAFHPYADTSGQSPDTPHPNSTTIGLADYDRLMRTLSTAFDGTAAGGLAAAGPLRRVRRRVEDPGREGEGLHRSRAGDDEARSTRSRRAPYYARALQLAFCQPNVVGILLFHSQDEPALASWQSGVYYADGTPKSSLYAVRDALARSRGGSIARCDGPRARRHGHEGRVPVAGGPRPRHARRPLHLHARLRLGAARARRGERRHARFGSRATAAPGSRSSSR